VGTFGQDRSPGYGMDLTLTDGQRAISRTAAEVLADCAATSGRRTAEGSDEWSRALWKQLADLGWTALSVPESYGGAGAGFLEACLVIEQLAAARVPSPYLLTVCAAEALRRFGTEQQLAAWLPEIAEGRPVGYVRAAADSVRGTGNSTIDAIDHGSGILLSGTAEFVPFAEAVDTFIVVAGRPSGLTTFLVGPVRTGLDRSRMDVVGPDPYYRVRFDRVPVAGDTVLGRWDRGQEVLAVFEAFGAGAVCAEMIGGAQRVLDLTLDHARNRRQFARPIGSFQAVRLTFSVPGCSATKPSGGSVPQGRRARRPHSQCRRPRPGQVTRTAASATSASRSTAPSVLPPNTNCIFT